MNLPELLAHTDAGITRESSTEIIVAYGQTPYCTAGGE